MVEFGGWLMPVQYEGILAEHRAVREQAGLFDISHMGQVRVEGAGASAWLDRMLTNHASALDPGCGHYSFLLNESGGVIDDLFVYRLSDEAFLLVINAAKRAEDMAWLARHLPAQLMSSEASPSLGRTAAVSSQTSAPSSDYHQIKRSLDGTEVIVQLQDDRAALALQGPASQKIAERFLDAVGVSAELPARNGVKVVAGLDLVIAATGYTGEKGFELFFHESLCDRVWESLLAAGTGEGMTLCGLGARDTLRLEMGYPLNGSDLDAHHSPLEAGTAWAVNFQKGDFVGRQALQAQRESGLQVRLSGFRVTEKSPPPRPHYPLLHDGQAIAEATSAALSPTMGIGIGMAYLPLHLAKPGTPLAIEIRGRHFAAEVAKRPFVKPYDAR